MTSVERGGRHGRQEESSQSVEALSLPLSLSYKGIFHQVNESELIPLETNFPECRFAGIVGGRRAAAVSPPTNGPCCATAVQKICGIENEYVMFSLHFPRGNNRIMHSSPCAFSFGSLQLSLSLGRRGLGTFPSEGLSLGGESMGHSFSRIGVGEGRGEGYRAN